MFILFLKSYQFDLFDAPVHVSGSVDKHGHVRKPHERVQKVRNTKKKSEPKVIFPKKPSPDVESYSKKINNKGESDKTGRAMNDINEKIAEYNRIRKESGRIKADEYGSKYISSLGLETPQERSQVWDKFKAERFAEERLADQNEKKAKKKAAAEKKANKADLKSLVNDIIGQTHFAAWSGNLSDREIKFLNDIKNKRKLTDKQFSWLSSIASKVGLEIKGEVERRQSRAANRANTLGFEDFVEEFFDQHVALMSSKDIAESKKAYQSFRDGTWGKK